MKYILVLVSINLAACATDRGATQHQCMQEGGCYRVTAKDMQMLKGTYMKQEAKIQELTSMLDKSCS